MKSLTAFDVLSLISGIFWTLTYLLIIERGFRDKTYGMPLLALCLNISWEFIFSFVLPHKSIQHIVDFVWLFLDTVILIQLLWFGSREFRDLRKPAFYIAFGLTLATSFFTIFFISSQIKDGGVNTAFGQNLLMSGLFITMLYQRKSLRGQSIWIAICKLLGTACVSLGFYLFPETSEIKESVLLPFLYISIFMYDLTYVGLIYITKNVNFHVETAQVGIYND
ncbi:transmembrane-type terpene cyclase [Nostoc sp.]|uniref:transmembrane-type terpene cyclase n=1 Tax=Nostoc sp. TaxID=1180 RepID=UPI002FEEB779